MTASTGQAARITQPDGGRYRNEARRLELPTEHETAPQILPDIQKSTQESTIDASRVEPRPTTTKKAAYFAPISSIGYDVEVFQENPMKTRDQFYPMSNAKAFRMGFVDGFGSVGQFLEQIVGGEDIVAYSQSPTKIECVKCGSLNVARGLKLERKYKRIREIHQAKLLNNRK